MKLLHRQRQGLVEQLGKLDIAVRALGGIRSSGATTRHKPQFTKAGLERIAAAQRARCAAATPLPGVIVSGKEPFSIIGAIAGG